MAALHPAENTRKRIWQVILVSLLIPGSGHLLIRRTGLAAVWFLLCQATLFGGLMIAGASQLDFGTWFGGAREIVFLWIPEMGNFLGSQVAAHLMTSVERGGRQPELFEFRMLGDLLTSASGILAGLSAAHAAGLALASEEGQRWRGRVNPGTAALASMILPGLGHWLTGRRFKALYFAWVVLGLFWLGMLLGEFADFHRERHPFYWVGQVSLGPVAWLSALVLAPIRFGSELPGYIDAGLLFTTTAGLFAIVVALDAYRRAEDDGYAAVGADAPATEAADDDPVGMVEEPA